MNIKEYFIAIIYGLSFKFFKLAIYSRVPFPRYIYMHSPQQLQALCNLLLSSNCEGSILEVGVVEGWTACYLLEAMKEAGMNRPYIGIDTFDGFLKGDYEWEYNNRNKQGENFENYFKINNKEWVEYSIKRFRYHNVKLYKADASTFDYKSIAPIAFCLLDIDLYRPIRETLPKIFKHVSTKGTIVVDDCIPNQIWDGAYQAYVEFCNEVGLERKIISDKYGIIQK